MTTLTFHHIGGVIQNDLTVSDDTLALIDKRTKHVTSKYRNNENFNIRRYDVGDTVDTTLLVGTISERKTRNGKDYLAFNFTNPNGNYRGKHWCNQGENVTILEQLKEHRVFNVNMTVDSYNGEKNLVIHHMSPVTGVDPALFLPSGNVDRQEEIKALTAYIDQLSPTYQAICNRLLATLGKDFIDAPAATFYHHNYVGGLLKHTVGLMHVAHYLMNGHTVDNLITIIDRLHQYRKDELARESILEDGDQTPVDYLIWNDVVDYLYTIAGKIAHDKSEINYDHVMTSILFHDTGKLMEYKYAGRTDKAYQYLFGDSIQQVEGSFDIDPLGQLIGHIPLSAMLFRDITREVDNTPDVTAMTHVMHNILSHHAKPEWGSCTKSPQTLDAWLVHIADYIDSRYDREDQYQQTHE